MGIKIYYIMVAAVLLFGLFMPQEGLRKKYYIILMAVLHAFVCGFRYKFLTGDLMKYYNGFSYAFTNGWTLSDTWNEGRNFLFYLLRNIIATLFNGDFQVFLLFIAIVSELFVAILVFRYSPRPWFSYLVWNCLCFYITGFSALKQSLAMALVMWAAVAIFEKKPGKFFLIMTVATFTHGPAAIFLPAYWIANRKIGPGTIWLSVAFSVVVFFLRTPIVNLISPLYYEDNIRFVIGESGLGTRFFFILGLLVLGLLIKGFDERRFSVTFHLITIAAILQMFSSFDNIFTRLCDYYFQFSILYLPMLFYQTEDRFDNSLVNTRPIFKLHPRLNSLAIPAAVGMLFLYYYATQLSVHYSYAVDDFLNFRFMWDV